MAERRYNEWQRERLRGFEAEQEKIRKWRETDATTKNQPQPQPSTSGIFNKVFSETIRYMSFMSLPAFK
jgi:hypothetical protein